MRGSIPGKGKNVYNLDLTLFMMKGSMPGRGKNVYNLDLTLFIAGQHMVVGAGGEPTGFTGHLRTLSSRKPVPHRTVPTTAPSVTPPITPAYQRLA